MSEILKSMDFELKCMKFTMKSTEMCEICRFQCISSLKCTDMVHYFKDNFYPKRKTKDHLPGMVILVLQVLTSSFNKPFETDLSLNIS